MRYACLLLVSPAALLLACGCAHAGAPAACSGKHKRPANLYGSVLTQGLKPAGPGAAPSADPAAPRPQQPSRTDLRASLTPCRSARA